jgi:hypothetical protein
MTSTVSNTPVLSSDGAAASSVRETTGPTTGRAAKPYREYPLAMAPPDRAMIRLALENVSPAELREIVRVLNVAERDGMLRPDEAAMWREEAAAAEKRWNAGTK